MSPDLALQQFQKAAALDPENPAIKTQIGVSEIDIGQSEQELAALEQVFGTEAGRQLPDPRWWLWTCTRSGSTRRRRLRAL